MRFLHIDDDENDRQLTHALIRRTKYWEYLQASSIEEGVEMWENDHPQVILIDIHFPGKSDREAFAAMRTMHTTSCVIALSGSEDLDMVNKARDAGAILFMHKSALHNPLAFHEAIVKGVERNLDKAVASNPSEALIKQLAEAVFYGNGKPSILSRLEAGDVRMQSIESKIDAIAEVQDGNRLETRLRGFAIIALLVFSFILELYKVHEGQHSDGIKNPMEEIQGK